LAISEKDCGRLFQLVLPLVPLAFICGYPALAVQIDDILAMKVDRGVKIRVAQNSLSIRLEIPKVAL
jgi:hypothetical protein